MQFVGFKKADQMPFGRLEDNPSCILAAKSLGPKNRSARSHGITMAGTGKVTTERA